MLELHQEIFHAAKSASPVTWYNAIFGSGLELVCSGVPTSFASSVLLAHNDNIGNKRSVSNGQWLHNTSYVRKLQPMNIQGRLFSLFLELRQQGRASALRIDFELAVYRYLLFPGSRRAATQRPARLRSQPGALSKRSFTAYCKKEMLIACISERAKRLACPLTARARDRETLEQCGFFRAKLARGKRPTVMAIRLADRRAVQAPEVGAVAQLYRREAIVPPLRKSCEPRRRTAHGRSRTCRAVRRLLWPI